MNIKISAAAVPKRHHPTLPPRKQALSITAPPFSKTPGGFSWPNTADYTIIAFPVQQSELPDVQSLASASIVAFAMRPYFKSNPQAMLTR
jgi:hypothetical protein